MRSTPKLLALTAALLIGAAAPAFAQDDGLYDAPVDPNSAFVRVLVPGAAACLTLADWQPWRLARQARASWSSKAAAYLVSGFIAQLVMAALAFGAGRILHRMLV